MNNTPTPPQGQTPTGGSALLRRRQRPADPLVRPKKPRPRQPTPNISLPHGSKPPTSNGQAKSNGFPASRQVSQAASTSQSAQGGLTEPYEDYPLYTTKRALLEGIRYHVMRFSHSNATKSVDPTDETQFTRPVRLHRRDPKANAIGHWREGGEEGDGADMNGDIDEKERERLYTLKAERQAHREAVQAEIAPVSKQAATRKKEFQKKTEQIYRVNNSEERKKQQAIKYEETLPWHLEDFDNKNTWAGTYEAALSDSHALFIPEHRGEDSKITNFRLIPIQKWYRFNAKNRFESLTIEEAELRMSKKYRDNRWFMETQRSDGPEIKGEPGRKLFTRSGERGERIKPEADDDAPEVAADADDIDYNYDEAFADDEENPLFGGDDEENKEAEEKIKREQREANIFQLKEEDKDYDEEEDKEKKKAKAEKKKAKRIQHALMKREKNYMYDTDSASNPYSSSSESNDSEAEGLAEEESKKDEAQKSSQDKLKVPQNEKAPSGSSSKGTNTPSGRPSKHSGSARSGILKRPGSPNLSEASGNESSRKKHKKIHDSASAGVSPSRATSPGIGDLGRSSIIKLNVDASKLNNIASRPPQPSRKRTNAVGSGSDGEGTGAEMSDTSTRPKKIKIRGGAGSRPSSKDRSRVASPTIASPGEFGRAGSPTSAKKAITPLTLEELAALIPPEGILMHGLLKNPSVKATPELIQKLKSVSRFEKETKLIKPKARPSEPTA